MAERMGWRTTKGPIVVEANQRFEVVDESEARHSGLSHNPNAVRPRMFWAIPTQVKGNWTIQRVSTAGNQRTTQSMSFSGVADGGGSVAL